MLRFSEMISDIVKVLNSHLSVYKVLNSHLSVYGDKRAMCVTIVAFNYVSMVLNHTRMYGDRLCSVIGDHRRSVLSVVR